MVLTLPITGAQNTAPLGRTHPWAAEISLSQKEKRLRYEHSRFGSIRLTTLAAAAISVEDLSVVAVQLAKPLPASGRNERLRAWICFA